MPTNKSPGDLIGDLATQVQSVLTSTRQLDHICLNLRDEIADIQLALKNIDALFAALAENWEQTNDKTN